MADPKTTVPPLGWQVVETRWGDRHVMPIGDLRPHIAGARCWCGPRQDDHDGYVIIHDAMDQRQEYERGTTGTTGAPESVSSNGVD